MNEEFGEDTLLASRLGAAMITGMQVCLKHARSFAAREVSFETGGRAHLFTLAFAHAV